jgi:putative DNA primase/helicase
MTVLSLSQIARAIGGQVSGNRVRFAPLGHSRRDRSAWIEIAPNLPDGFYVGTFAADDPLAIKDYVKERLGIAGRKGWAPRVPSVMRDDAERTAGALKIWSQAQDPRATPVKAYLTCPRPHGRGVELPREAIGEAIRFHPHCPFRGTTAPVMICLVRDVVSDEPRAIHRTALSPEGRNVKIGGADRLSLGPIRGGAIKLTPDQDVSLCLGIGEGIESTLSLRNRPEFGRSPVWSLISAGGIEKLPVLAGIESLWIAVDNDASGRGPQAARTCAERWRGAGREVFLVTPSAQGVDLNDIPADARHA